MKLLLTTSLFSSLLLLGGCSTFQNGPDQLPIVAPTPWNTELNKLPILDGEPIYKKLRNKYDVIFYTSPKDVELVDDGERSVDVHFREDIIDLFNLYLYSINKDNKDKPRVILLEGTVEERLETIKSTLDKLNIDIKI